MKKLYFLLILLPAINSMTAQVEFAPAGADWYYRYQTGYTNVPGDGFQHAWYSGDTVLLGRACKVICSQTVFDAGDPVTVCGYRRYLTQQADSVFEFVVSEGDVVYPNGDLRFLFRNQYTLGEAVQGPGYSFTVTTLDTLLFNGIAVQRFGLSIGSSVPPVYIYDRFGPEYGLDNFLSPYTIDLPSKSLRCYEDAAFPRVSFTTDPCDRVIQPIKPEYTFYLLPNPVRKDLNIWYTGPAIGAAEFQVFDASGRLVLMENRGAFSSTKLDVSSLSAGFYVLAVRVGGTNIWQKFIKN